MPLSGQNREQGFSLIELLVASVVGMLVLGAVTNVFINQKKSYQSQDLVSEMQQNARAVMDLITHEVKMAGYDPTGANFVAIEHDTSQLQIRADLDGDGATTAATEPNENITYSYDAGNKTILRDAGSGDEIVADNIDAFDFSYRDANDDVTMVEALIRMIQVTITARARAADPNYSDNGGIRTYQLISKITPLNLSF